MAYFIVGVFIVSAFVCHRIAKSKNLNAAFWIVLGSFIGPLAIPLVILTRSKNLSGKST